MGEIKTNAIANIAINAAEIMPKTEKNVTHFLIDVKLFSKSLLTTKTFWSFFGSFDSFVSGDSLISIIWFY